jgi:hypothetical protein
MSGPMDPNRHSTFELSPTDILRWVKDICKTTQTEFSWGLEPYSRDRLAQMVSNLALAGISLYALTYLSSRNILCASIFRYHFVF